MLFRPWAAALRGAVASAIAKVLLLLLVLASALVAACNTTEVTKTTSGSGNPSGAPGDQPPVTTLFSPAITSVTIEVDYAPGAEPYVGTVKDFGDPWELFNANVLALFEGKKAVEFPRTLAKMEKLDDVDGATFTTQEVLDIAAAHRTEPQYSDAVAFYIVFLPGIYVDDEGNEQPKTLGLSIGNTGVVALFKPAIKTPVGNPTAPPQFVEQLALVHFLGHAVGFVDNGVPVGENNRAHVDLDNPHHCTNTQCAMHVGIESVSGAVAFAKTLIRSSQAVLIGQECLSDARILESSQLSK